MKEGIKRRKTYTWKESFTEKNQEKRGERNTLKMIKKVKENKVRSNSGTVTRYCLSKGSVD